MKKILTSLTLLTILAAACIPTPEPTPSFNNLAAVVGTMMAATLTAVAPTPVVPPTNIPFVLPKGDFEMKWNTYNSEYNSMGGIVTIRRQGSKYTEKLEFPDGSNGTFDLTVVSVGSEIKLKGHLGITSSLYGDYMVIDRDGKLVFYDDQGYIYGVSPLH